MNVNGEPCAPRGARTVREGVGIPGLPHDLEIDVSRLKLVKANYQSQKYAMEDRLLKYFPREVKLTEERIAGFKADMSLYEQHKTEDFPGMVLNGDRKSTRLNSSHPSSSRMPSSA